MKDVNISFTITTWRKHELKGALKNKLTKIAEINKKKQNITILKQKGDESSVPKTLLKTFPLPNSSVCVTNITDCYLASFLQHFQHQQSAKHPQYYSTMRLGRSLKDRCMKADHEREILSQMLEDLKNKWNIIRSIVAQRWVVGLEARVGSSVLQFLRVAHFRLTDIVSEKWCLYFFYFLKLYNRKLIHDFFSAVMTPDLTE